MLELSDRQLSVQFPEDKKKATAPRFDHTCANNGQPQLLDDIFSCGRFGTRALTGEPGTTFSPGGHGTGEPGIKFRPGGPASQSYF